MQDLTVSLLMLVALAVAPWMANAIAMRTVDRFASNEHDEPRDAGLQRVD
ncbi:MAG: hypothetical protein ACRDKJ_03135 [Actinomycetota bacterium]